MLLQALQTLLAALLLVVVALGGVLLLAWVATWLNILRWRVRSGAAINPVDSESAAVRSALAPLDDWAAREGFRLEQAFLQDAPVDGFPPAPGRWYCDEAGTTRLAVTVPPAPLHRLRWLVSFHSHRSDGVRVLTLGGYAGFVVLPPLLPDEMQDAAGLELDAIRAHHAGRVAGKSLDPLPSPERHRQLVAELQRAAVERALLDGALRVRADGALHFSPHGALGVFRRQLRAVRRLQSLARPWWRRQRTAPALRVDAPPTSRQRAATLAIAALAGAITFALLTQAGPTVRAYLECLPSGCAPTVEWPTDIAGWESRIRDADTPALAAADAYQAIDLYASDENWPAVRRLLVSALPAMRQPAVPADERLHLLADLAGILQGTWDSSLLQQGGDVFDEAIALCARELADDHGCASVPLLARADARFWRNEDAVAARSDYLAALESAARAEDRHGHEIGRAAAALARLDRDAGDLPGEEAWLRRVLARSGPPDILSIGAWVALANLQSDAGNLPAARELLVKMADGPWEAWLAADAPRAARTELAWIYLAGGDATAALAVVEGDHADRDPEWLVAGWLAARAADRPGEARRALDAMLTLQAEADNSWGRNLRYMDRAPPQYSVGLSNADRQEARLALLRDALQAEADLVRREDPARAEAILDLIDRPRAQCQP